MRSIRDLRISQNKIFECGVDNDIFMFAADMGIGKTAAVATLIDYRLWTLQNRHALVIAPLLVAEETWPNEFERWEHLHDLDYEVLTGDPERRKQRTLRLPPVSIINRENINWLIDFWGDKWPYDLVVIDEMSSFKNPKKRNKPTALAVQKEIERVMATMPKGFTQEDAEMATRKAVGKLRGQLTRFGGLCRVRSYIDCIYGMTGTPSPNGMEDIWSQYYLLDQGRRLESCITKYRTRFFEKSRDGFNYILRQGAFPMILERIKDITISMKTEDFTDMPDVVYNTIEVTLPPKVLKTYRRLAREMCLKEMDVEAVNNGVLTGKLLQLANGSVYNDDGDVVEVHDLKLEALDRVIEEAAGAPVLVAYSYQFDLEKLRKRYPQAEVAGEVKNLEKRWNAGEIPILLAHPQAAGHGLNLQYGGHIMVWYGLCWSLEYYQQMCKRLRRPGQEKIVFIHHLVAKGTVDERVMQVLPEKEATQDALMEATRWVPEVA